jgi:DnaK suppressor protein
MDARVPRQEGADPVGCLAQCLCRRRLVELDGAPFDAVDARNHGAGPDQLGERCRSVRLGPCAGVGRVGHGRVTIRAAATGGGYARPTMENAEPEATWAPGVAGGPMTDVLADDHGDEAGLDHDDLDVGPNLADQADQGVRSDQGSEADQADQGGSGAPAHVDSSTARRSVDDIERLLDGVEAALGRLDDGTYGVCVSCGSPLTDERLTASPTATRCAMCDPTDREG